MVLPLTLHLGNLNTGVPFFSAANAEHEREDYFHQKVLAIILYYYEFAHSNFMKHLQIKHDEEQFRFWPSHGPK